MIVVKVGGSLFDHPGLGSGLRDFVASLSPAQVLLVPGGGPVADAVRELDRVHGLGEEAAHWLALRALGVTAAFLERLIRRPSEQTDLIPPFSEKEGGARETVGGIRRVGPLKQEGQKTEDPLALPSALGRSEEDPSPLASLPLPPVAVLDCFAFALEDDSRPGALPHSWCVTTDSIAARAAAVLGAEKLILLKSVDIPSGTSWEIAAANGWVDARFPHVAATLACPIEVINFRLFGK